MPKGLYFTAVVFSFFFFLLSFFFRHLISEVTERISIKPGHKFTYDCYVKNLVPTPLDIHPYGLGAKPLFCDRLWTLTDYISATKHDINNRKETYQFTTTPLYAPNVANFGPETAENYWRVCANPPKFSHWETLPALPHGRYITDSRQTLAHVM